MAHNCRFAFAVHILSVLAYDEPRGAECVSSETLSKTVNTNAVVIRRMLLDLRAAGLVETQRGPHGGARLARGADEITLAQIYRAVEGEMQLFGSHPKQPAQSCPVGREIGRVLNDVATRAQNAVVAQYEATSLNDVVREMKLS